MSRSTANFASRRHGPDHMLLEALLNDSEEEWMRIIREQRSDIIGLPVCPLICVLKRWTATLQMLADFRRSFFRHALFWKRSILYRHIRNDVFVANAELKWPSLSHSAMALIIAVREGYIEGMRALLKFVAMPSPIYWFGDSALLEAVASRSIETVRAFLDSGAKDYFVKKYGMTAAAQAGQLGELEMMREIGWSANDDLVLEHGVCGGSMDVVKAIVAVRTKKFNLERTSRLTTDGSLCKLLSEANAALPEKAPSSTGSLWRWFCAKLRQVNATSKK